MSLIITIHTNEGMVMASDSRTTYNSQNLSPLPDGKGAIITNNQGIHYSDTTYKTFQLNKNIGISTCGDASLGNKPITGYIEDFINSCPEEDTPIKNIADMILEFFSKYNPLPDVVFHIAGYEKNDNGYFQKFYRVFVKGKRIEEIDVSLQGAAWNGETERLARLISPNWNEITDDNGNKSYFKNIPPAIPWNFFSLQDAIDFATFAIKTTIETMRFQECLKTVGGPIDILVIKPSGTSWISRKELHSNT